MFVDTSAVVAILASEPEARALALKLEGAREPISAGHVLLEASMRLGTLLGFAPTAADTPGDAHVSGSGNCRGPITEDIAHLAVGAFERYGKGRGHAARLSFGDCLTYACAKAHNVPILFRGRRFCADRRDAKFA